MAFFDRIEEEVSSILETQRGDLLRSKGQVMLDEEEAEVNRLQEELASRREDHVRNASEFEARFAVPTEEVPQG